jgi:hypothetical protein
MKTYFLKRIKNLLWLLGASLIGGLVAYLRKGNLSINSDNIYMFKAMGIGILAVELINLLIWLYKQKKQISE